MDRSRRASRAGNEVTLQHKSRKQALLIEQLAEEKLGGLSSVGDAAQAGGSAAVPKQGHRCVAEAGAIADGAGDTTDRGEREHDCGEGGLTEAAFLGVGQVRGR